jgi:hypothetical protein
MAGSVRAAVLVKPKTIEFREFARPAIGRGDALLNPLHIAIVPGAPRVAIP